MDEISWADGPLVAFDIESTGVDPESERIVTASLITIVGGTPRIREWLADPGIDIPAGATEVHGITTEHAQAHGRNARTVTREIAQALAAEWQDGHPVIIFNAAYDLTLLDREMRRHYNRGLDHLGPVIDPLVLDRACDPYRKGPGTRKLTYVCQQVYGVPLSDEDAHGSTADAFAAARVAWKIAKRYPAVGEATLTDLQSYQRDCHREWAENFGAFLTRQGKADDVDRSWPLRPFDLVGVPA